VSENRFTDEQVDAAIDALGDPKRFRDAETRLTRVAPQLQRILAAALQEGGWFGEAHESEVRKAAGEADEEERRARIKTLLAEETRMGMLVGVAVGWELARELEMTGEPERGD
jgi:hypothetical protein